MQKAIPSVRLTFYGAAKTVTGSKYLVEVDDKKVLVDCGLFQGKKELRKRNWENPPFRVDDLSAIVLTHAHIDHTGYLPLVVKRGYRGPIYCTAATKELLNLVLPDSAHLQEEQARYQHKHKSSKHNPPKPLYDTVDAINTLKQLVVVEKNVTTKLFSNISITPTRAGHILGSTSIALDCYNKRINFSGDVGRYNMPILPDPEPIDMGDLFLCESTYGNRDHKENDILFEIEQAIKTAYLRKGPIIIPAFAIGRTQILLYYLAMLEREGRIPSIPIFIDTPMGVSTTGIYKNFKYDFDKEARELIEEGQTPLQSEKTYLCKSVKESKALNHLKGPRIIISASGMVTGGRILHHMIRHLPKEETTVLFVGYQAEGTRGRIIQKKSKSVKIFGEYVQIRANIKTISGLSAHADSKELLRWIKSSNSTPRMVKVVHGEKDSANTFKETLKEKLNLKASVANYKETVEL